MNALTICEPYASLIALPDDDPRAKRVENRTWWPSNRVIGSTIAIHAGKSRKFLCGDNYGLRREEMKFGAVVAVVRVAECARTIGLGHLPEGVERKYALLGHQHVEGPVCWILREVRRLPEPVPCKGAQGLWRLPDDVAEQVQAQIAR